MAFSDLRDAVQDFACELAEESVIVNVALIAWEEVSYDDDGDIIHRVRYAIPTDNVNMSTATGLATLARDALLRDINGEA